MKYLLAIILTLNVIITKSQELEKLKTKCKVKYLYLNDLNISDSAILRYRICDDNYKSIIGEKRESYDNDCIIYRIDWINNSLIDSTHYIDLEGKSRNIYFNVKRKPEYIGGLDSLYDFVYKFITYPPDYDIEGFVFVSFIVEKSGELSNIRIISGIENYTNSECINLIKNMKNWKPGKYKNMNVPVLVILPIYYKLF